MVRKIKFPLIMKDNVEVRTIEELRVNFYSDKILEYFMNGKLQKWLEDRYYEDEANKISQINIKENSKNIISQICSILELDSIKERKDLLKQFTNDKKWLEKIDYIAFTQEELDSNLLNWNFDKTSNKKETYICGNDFLITDEYNDITYIGVDQCTVSIKANKSFNAIDKNIKFKNLRLTSDEVLEVLFENNENCNIDDNKIKPKKRPMLYKSPMSFEGKDIKNYLHQSMMLYKNKIIIPTLYSIIKIIDINTKRVWTCDKYLENNIPLDNSSDSILLHEEYTRKIFIPGKMWYFIMELYSVQAMNIVGNTLVCACKSESKNVFIWINLDELQIEKVVCNNDFISADMLQILEEEIYLYKFSYDGSIKCNVYSFETGKFIRNIDNSLALSSISKHNYRFYNNNFYIKAPDNKSILSTDKSYKCLGFSKDVTKLNLSEEEKLKTNKLGKEVLDKGEIGVFDIYNNKIITTKAEKSYESWSNYLKFGSTFKDIDTVIPRGFIAVYFVNGGDIIKSIKITDSRIVAIKYYKKMIIALAANSEVIILNEETLEIINRIKLVKSSNKEKINIKFVNLYIDEITEKLMILYNEQLYIFE